MTDTVGNFVRITRLIRAPRQTVYNAWLDPKIRTQWWCASPEMKPGVCTIDPTPGGKYRVGMIAPDGKEHIVVGEFIELNPHNKLVFTWTWESNPDFGGNSQVTIELFDATFNDEPATELLLTHENLTQPFERSDHTTGWLGCLKSLGKFYADLDDSYVRTLDINAPIDKVYDAITTRAGLAAWWTDDCDIATAVDGKSTFRFGTTYNTQKIVALNRPNLVHWHCVDQHHENPDLARTFNEWVGTDITFKLSQTGESSTRLQLTHAGLVPSLLCYDICNAGWNHFTDSLKAFCETGKGNPATS